MQQIDSIGNTSSIFDRFFYALPSSVPVSFSFSPRFRFAFFSISFGFAEHLYELIVCCFFALYVVFVFFVHSSVDWERSNNASKLYSSRKALASQNRTGKQTNATQHSTKKGEGKKPAAAAAITTAHQTAKWKITTTKTAPILKRI